MRLEIRKAASNTIAATRNWVEGKNTKGAGDRWLVKLFEELNKRAKLGVKHALCKNQNLRKRKYSCFTYNGKWVVAYKIEAETFIVCRIIAGSMLV